MIRVSDVSIPLAALMVVMRVNQVSSNKVINVLVKSSEFPNLFLHVFPIIGKCLEKFSPDVDDSYSSFGLKMPWSLVYSSKAIIVSSM